MSMLVNPKDFNRDDGLSEDAQKFRCATTQRFDPPDGYTFKSLRQIKEAAELLASDYLPTRTRKVLGRILVEAITEIQEKGITIKSLLMEPPKKGRKSEPWLIRQVYRRVDFYCRRRHMSKTKAYAKIAGELNKSHVTIRRIWERCVKSLRDGLPPF